MGTNNCYESAELMLWLFDLRREAQLRKARNWYLDNFCPASIGEIEQKYPYVSEAATHIRMVLGCWNKRTLNIRKSIWQQHLGPVKAEESEKVMPLDDEMITDLLRWRGETPYTKD
ncbi:MAG: hypothetical protein WCE53_17160 [Candidatus Acidiferrum sp.]